MTGGASDDRALQPHVTTKRQKKRIEKRFKNPVDPLRRKRRPGCLLDGSQL